MSASVTAGDWFGAMRRAALRYVFDEFDLAYQVAIDPAIPPDYAADDMVALTYRLSSPQEPRLRMSMNLKLPAILRIGERVGFDFGEALAMVDSHERMHIHLQLAGVAVEDEERQNRVVDAVWLSLRNARAEALLPTGAFGLVSHVGDDFWEAVYFPEDAGESSSPVGASPAP